MQNNSSRPLDDTFPTQTSIASNDDEEIIIDDYEPETNDVILIYNGPSNSSNLDEALANSRSGTDPGDALVVNCTRELLLPQVGIDTFSWLS